MVSLEGDRLYWITLSAGLPDSDLALCSAHEILWNSRVNLIGERIDSGDWNVFRTSGYVARGLGRAWSAPQEGSQNSRSRVPREDNEADRKPDQLGIKAEPHHASTRPRGFCASWLADLS